MEPMKLPREVDQPRRVLFWTVDQLIPMIFAVVIGMVTDYFFSSLAVGLALAWLMGRFRDSRADGYVLHWLYWHGFVPMKARAGINPFIRLVLPR